MASNVIVTLNKVAVMARVKTDKKRATTIVANELLKDANYYCREDSGELKRSGIRASKPAKGLLIWDALYAKRMYYIGTPSKDKNPNASKMWAEKAAKKNKKKYLKMAQKVINGEA